MILCSSVNSVALLLIQGDTLLALVAVLARRRLLSGGAVRHESIEVAIRRITHRKTVRTHVKCHLRQPDSSHRLKIDRSTGNWPSLRRYLTTRCRCPLNEPVWISDLITLHGKRERWIGAPLSLSPTDQFYCHDQVEKNNASRVRYLWDLWYLSMTSRPSDGKLGDLYLWKHLLLLVMANLHSFYFPAHKDHQIGATTPRPHLE